MKNSISVLSARKELTDIPVIGKIIDLAIRIWDWLIEGARENFWGSRLFWSISILLAVTCLILCIVLKKHSAEYRRRQVAAIDRLRDDSLSDALRRKAAEDEEKTEPPASGYMLMRPKYRRMQFVLINQKSELSSQEMILPVENDITIGRSDVCSIILKDRFAAAQHCVISAEGRKLFISALQSELPTFLRRRKRIIQLENGEKYRLRSRGCFQAGSTRFDVIIFRCRIPGGYI